MASAMAFDGEHFDLPPPRRPQPGRGEIAFMVVLGVLAVLLMALPVPFASLTDIIHYVGGRR